MGARVVDDVLYLERGYLGEVGLTAERDLAHGCDTVTRNCGPRPPSYLDAVAA